MYTIIIIIAIFMILYFFIMKCDKCYWDLRTKYLVFYIVCHKVLDVVTHEIWNVSRCCDSKENFQVSLCFVKPGM